MMSFNMSDDQVVLGKRSGVEWQKSRNQKVMTSHLCKMLHSLKCTLAKFGLQGIYFHNLLRRKLKKVIIWNTT